MSEVARNTVAYEHSYHEMSRESPEFFQRSETRISLKVERNSMTVFPTQKIKKYFA